MYTIEYCEDGVAIPDAQLRSFAAEWSGNPRDIKISTFTAIDAIRVEILRGKISHTEVQLKFGKALEVFTETAQLRSWPDQYHVSILRDLVNGVSRIKAGEVE